MLTLNFNKGKGRSSVIIFVYLCARDFRKNIPCFTEAGKPMHHSSNMLAVSGRPLSRSTLTLRFLHHPISVDENVDLVVINFFISAHTVANTNTFFPVVAVRRHLKNLRQYQSQI